MVSNKTLGKIATYIAVGGITGLMLMRSKIQDDIRRSQVFKVIGIRRIFHLKNVQIFNFRIR